MSSSTWTRDALSSEARPAAGQCWRLVEAQHHVSTRKLTDSSAEQARLEALLEATKPPLPDECAGLNYLLFTPFRYAAYPQGSRFRRAGWTPGVFYASETPRTAATEVAFHRLLFFAESPATPWPANPGEYTAFAITFSAARAIDLRAPALAAHAARWSHPTDYAESQHLADDCRARDIDVIRYRSVRDPIPAANIAILRCRAFTRPDPVDRQTWRIQLGASGVSLICEFPKMHFDLDRGAFAADPRIAQMVWERSST